MLVYCVCFVLLLVVCCCWSKRAEQHATQELYGGKSTDRLLNALSRLLTHYLQMRGFTCGMDDLYLTTKVCSTQKCTFQHRLWVLCIQGRLPSPLL